MKILRILNRFNIGGPTHNALYLTKHLYPEFTTKLIGGMKLDSEGSFEYILEKNNINYEYIADMHRSINIIADFKSYIAIKKIIKSFKPDIVHTHAAKSGALGRLAAINSNVPIIIHTFHGHVFHSYFGRLKSFIFILIERFLCNRSTKVIAISDLQKRDLVEKYKICDKEKVAVIPLGFDLNIFVKNHLEKKEKFINEFNIQPDETTIGIIGRLTPVKNHKLFLDSIKHLLEITQKKVRIFIVGDGEDRKAIEDYTKQLGISFVNEKDSSNKEIISFTSWRKDIDVIYAGLDIVCLTSLNEGTPVSLIEAQASRIPVVTTNVGGIADIVIDQETGFILDEGNHEDIAIALKKLIEDEVLRKQMGDNGFKNVYEKYSYIRLVSDIRNLYKHILESKGEII